MKYTLKQLEVFSETAHFESVSKAADRLAMSQSAASGALKELESNIGFQLFDRVGKRLKISSKGMEIRSHVEALLTLARELDSGMQGQLAMAPVNVGATLTIGSFLALKMIANYKDTHPDASIALSIANTQEIARRVENFELDVGLVEGEINHPSLVVEPWFSDELSVFCAPNSKLAKKGYIKDKELVQHAWILREQGSGTRQTFDRAFSGILSKLEVILELDHTEAIIQAVLAGLGLSCLSQLALQDAFAAKTLVPLKVQGRSLSRTCYIIQRRDHFQSQGLVNWLAVCDAFKNI